MPWFKVDDQLHSHPKVMEAGLEAMGLWALAGSYASQYGTRGVVSRAAVARLAGSRGKRLAQMLVAAGLWTVIDDGWLFHDWNQFQPAPEVIDERRDRLREERSRAGRTGASKRWQQGGKPDGKPMANAMANRWQTDSKPMAPIPIPIQEANTPLPPEGGRDGSAVSDQAPEQPHLSSEAPAGRPRSDLALMRPVLQSAYERGVRRGRGGAPLTFNPRSWFALDRVVTALAPPDSADAQAWVEREAEAFARGADPRFASGFSAEGFERWMNAGRPAANAGRPGRMVQPVPAGGPIWKAGLAE